MEKNETPKNLALLTADEVTLSILEVDAEGVRIKLWPDVNAVRAHLEECCERMPGGLAGYSVRHYVCGRYLYCAVALADITKDAPCPTTYRVSSDAPTNEADGSFLAAAAAWSIGAGVLNLPPLRIPASKVHIVPQGKPGTNIIERYVLDDALTLDDITYNGDGSVASLRVRKRDGSVMGSINALCAADWVIIPVDCDKWACDGMQEIVEQIEQVQAYYNPRLKIMGALMTKYRRTRYAEDIIVQLCASGISVLETVIRYTVKVSEAAHAGMPLLEYCPDCTAAVDYRELTEEVERIVSNVDTKEG